MCKRNLFLTFAVVVSGILFGSAISCPVCLDKNGNIKKPHVHNHHSTNE